MTTTKIQLKYEKTVYFQTGSVGSANPNHVYTNMQSMFNTCSSLTELDVTHFITDNVTNMASMFGNCSGLSQLDVTKFNTAKVTNMQNMFNGC